MVQLQPGQTLYDAMGIEKTATPGEIRKAYLKLAVQLHPDKNLGDDEASARFQTLQKVYSILSDPEKKKLYDDTGCIDDDSDGFSGQQFDSLYDYYRNMFAPVTEEAIEDFSTTYRNSKEERADLLKYYEQFKGNMDKVFQWVILSEVEVDSHRFMDILDEAISLKEVPRFAKYTTWAKGVARRPRPDAAAVAKKRHKKADNKGKGKKEGGDEDVEGALVAAITKRQAQFNNMTDNLEQKYCGKKPRSTREQTEPTEEEFEAARQRIEARKNKSTKK